MPHEPIRNHDLNNGSGDFAQVEALLRNARSTVVLNDDLRAKTLEAAQDAVRDKRLHQSIGASVLAMIFICNVASLGWGWFQSCIEASPDVSVERVEHRAYEIASETGSSYGSAYVDSFQEIRQEATRKLLLHSTNVK